jgi:hypothetical protein
MMIKEVAHLLSVYKKDKNSKTYLQLGRDRTELTHDLLDRLRNALNLINRDYFWDEENGQEQLTNTKL